MLLLFYPLSRINLEHGVYCLLCRKYVSEEEEGKKQKERKRKRTASRYSDTNASQVQSVHLESVTRSRRKEQEDGM